MINIQRKLNILRIVVQSCVFSYSNATFTLITLNIKILKEKLEKDR